jgi:hypothetical protein
VTDVPAPAIGGYGEWAWQYREQGWISVLPLPYRKKTPPPADYTGQIVKKTGLAPHIPDDPQIAAWVELNPRGNLCLRMPGDVIGIDVDAYEYRYRDKKTGEMVDGLKTGDIVIAEMEDQLGELPATWRSSSRTEGVSGIRFYRVPASLSWHDVGEHVETIWWGHRYAAVWPSINPDSDARYLWLDENDPDSGWGPWIPKVTELPELPEAWVRHLSQETVTKSALVGPTEPRPDRQRFLGSHDPSKPRQFTRRQAAEFVQPHLDELRHAGVGMINNRLNDAAKVISHFVPEFWRPEEADRELWAALRATAYDGKSWKAERTIASAFDSVAGDWRAQLVEEAAPRQERAALAVPEPEDGPEPPEDDPGPDGQTEDAFWESRALLAHIYDHATAKYASPWAVLGTVLARAVAAVEPNIQLPAAIGTEASMNLYIALVGTSGGGKDIAFGVAEQAIDIWEGQDLQETDVIPLGSGEGLAHVYMRLPPKLTAKKSRPDDDSAAIGLGVNPDPDKPIQHRTRALITIAEIDTLEAIGQRRGSTLGGQLRQAWNGGQIGFHYVDVAKRMIVPKHVYRMCLVASVQPGRAGALLAETDGGTPQRFLWLPATRADMTRDDSRTTPDPMGWEPPRYQAKRVLFDQCPSAVDAIIDNHIKRQRGVGDALDGHSVLNRVKVAAALAILDTGRPMRERLEITEEDWRLAGVVQAVSDRTRAGVERHLKEAAREENTRKAIGEAHKTIVMAETIESDGLRRAIRWLRGKAGADWVTEQQLREKIKGSQKRYLAEAIDRLQTAGEIEVGEYTANNKSARQVRRRGLGD